MNHMPPIILYMSVNRRHAIIIVIVFDILCRLNITNLIWVEGDLTVD